MFTWDSAVPCREAAFCQLELVWVSLYTAIFVQCRYTHYFLPASARFSLYVIMKGSLCSMLAATAEGNGLCLGKPAALTSSATPNILEK